MGNGTSVITVEPGWTHKEAAAAQLGVSIRQLENLAALGRIRKNRLARQVNERSARVLYSLDDIEAIKEGKPRLPDPSETPAPERTLTRRDSVPWGDLIEQLAAIARAVPSPDRQTEQLGAMVTAISQAFSIPSQEREAAAERERAMMASIDRFIELLATRQNEQAAETERMLAAIAQAFPPPQPKPWLTLSEAEAYSGLPRAWLIAQARAGALRAVNVGHGAREFWRFNREGLAK